AEAGGVFRHQIVVVGAATRPAELAPDLILRRLLRPQLRFDFVDIEGLLFLLPLQAVASGADVAADLAPLGLLGDVGVLLRHAHAPGRQPSASVIIGVCATPEHSPVWIFAQKPGTKTAFRQRGDGRPPRTRAAGSGFRLPKMLGSRSWSRKGFGSAT